MDSSNSLTFRLYAPGFPDDASMRLVGSPAALGSWKPESGLKMNRVEHGWFQAVVQGFPTITGDFEYKYVAELGNEVFHWEWTPNRTGRVDGRTPYAVEYFNHVEPLYNEEEAHSSLRVMCFNIRYENLKDGLLHWNLRRVSIVEMIEKYAPLVIGLQEVLHGQLLYLGEKLSKSYSYVGVGRDDGIRAGEYSPIFYNHEKLQLLDSGTFWISETPWEVGSRSWSAACTRICTWAKLQLRDGAYLRPFFIFNTHLDHVSQKARIEGLRLINNIMHAWSRSCPAIVTGDFNELPKHSALANVLNPKLAFPLPLKDSHDSCAKIAPGPEFTFNNWDCQTNCCWIDYILVKPFMNVTQFEVVNYINASGEMVLLSDHFPIVADLTVNLSSEP